MSLVSLVTFLFSFVVSLFRSSPSFFFLTFFRISLSLFFSCLPLVLLFLLLPGYVPCFIFSYHMFLLFFSFSLLCLFFFYCFCSGTLSFLGVCFSRLFHFCFLLSRFHIFLLYFSLPLTLCSCRKPLGSIRLNF